MFFGIRAFLLVNTLFVLFCGVAQANRTFYYFSEATEVCEYQGPETQREDAVCVERAIDISAYGVENYENVAYLPSLHMMTALRADQSKENMTPEEVAAFEREAILSNNVAQMAAGNISDEHAQILINSFDKIEIRDMATPVTILHLMATEEVNGKEVSLLQSNPFGSDLSTVKITEEYVEFPVMFKVFWKPNTGEGIRPSVTTFVKANVQIPITEEGTEVSNISELFRPNLVEYSEYNVFDTIGRRIVVSGVNIEGADADEKTQKLIEDVIAPYVTDAIFTSQLVSLLSSAFLSIVD